mmetsp:Transcript_10006/g.21625  ORF Transcript_10006/g.21625 Transcript_10006/m.21625 type:complete len:464 (-) Transcript_10006:1541-2932(-)
MVYITSKNNVISATIEASIKSSTNDMPKKIDQIKEYYAAIDGSTDQINSIMPLLVKLFHPQLVIESNINTIPYEDFVCLVHKFARNGCVAELVDIHDNDDGSCTVIVNNHLPGENGDVTKQRVFFKDEMIVRITAEETYERKFGAMLDRVSGLSTDGLPTDIVDMYARMLNCFDGSDAAFETAEPIIDEIFDANLVVVHGDNSIMDMAGFKSFASAFSRNHNIAKLEKSERTENGLRIVVRNIVDGVDQGAVEQEGLVENGKIVYWAATPGEESGFDRLVNSVGMTDNIQRLRDYLSALDGSPSAFERFEPHIDRVLARDIVWEDGDGSTMGYDDIIALLRDQYIPNGCYPVLESVKVNDDGSSLTVRINNHLPGEDGDATEQILYYGDDDRIHRLISAPFFKTCERIASLPISGSTCIVFTTLTLARYRPGVCRPSFIHPWGRRHGMYWELSFQRSSRSTLM